MSYLRIEEEGLSPSGKTKIFSVRATSGAMLGEIKWFSAWRKYCFFPEAATVFDRDCLEMIGNYCWNKTQVQRGERGKK